MSSASLTTQALHRTVIQFPCLNYVCIAHVQRHKPLPMGDVVFFLAQVEGFLPGWPADDQLPPGKDLQLYEDDQLQYSIITKWTLQGGPPLTRTQALAIVRNLTGNFGGSSTRPELREANVYETTIIVRNQAGQHRMALIIASEMGRKMTIKARQPSMLAFNATFYGGERALPHDNALAVLAQIFDTQMAEGVQEVARGAGWGFGDFVVYADFDMRPTDAMMPWPRFTHREIASIIRVVEMKFMREPIVGAFGGHFYYRLNGMDKIVGTWCVIRFPPFVRAPFQRCGTTTREANDNATEAISISKRTRSGRDRLLAQ